MNLDYAVQRLYEVGWTPGLDTDVETLANGTPFPSMEAIRREFAEHGLALMISHNPQFNCYRATWLPQRGASVSSADDDGSTRDDYGTVIGSCEREAAVYALAQFREHKTQKLQQLAAV